jgi:hypothetical protein
MKLIYYDENGWQLENYLNYLEEIKDRLPLKAREFAFLEGHYDITHKRCPHDSWVEWIAIQEIHEWKNDRIKGERPLKITARFLNAFHDGWFELTYEDVQQYSLSLDRIKRIGLNDKIHGPKIGHGDWIVDEILLDSDGFISHEIEFRDSALWKIKCANIIYQWFSESIDNPILHH